MTQTQQQQSAAATPPPVTNRTESYSVRLALPSGTILEGAFEIRAHEDADRIPLARIRANLAGVPWDNLDAGTQNELIAQAFILRCCTDAPDWCPLTPEGLQGQPRELILRLGGLVVEHTESYFRGVRTTHGTAPERPIVSCERILAGTGVPGRYNGSVGNR